MLPPPLDLLALVDGAEEADALHRAATAQGLVLRTVDDATAALQALDARWPDVLVLALGRHEEEAALLCRAARRRATERARELRIVMVDRGAHLVESADEATELGADLFLADLDAEALVATLCPEPDATPAHATPPQPLPVLSRSGARPGPLDADAIVEKLEQVRHADYFVVLGLARDATGDDIARAYVALRQRFDPHKARDTPHHAALVEIADALADAVHVLGDARLRRRYREALTPPR